MRRIIIIIIGLVIGACLTSAVAHADTLPANATPYIINTGHTYNLDWRGGPGQEWEFDSGSNYIVNGDVYSAMSVQVATVAGTNWQLYIDANNNNCIFFSGNAAGQGYLVEHPCDAGKPSDLWASATIGNPNNWAMWNKYIKDENQSNCTNNLAPVITGFAVIGSKLIMECPDGNMQGTQYGLDQQWGWAVIS